MTLYSQYLSQTAMSNIGDWPDYRHIHEHWLEQPPHTVAPDERWDYLWTEEVGQYGASLKAMFSRIPLRTPEHENQQITPCSHPDCEAKWDADRDVHPMMEEREKHPPPPEGQRFPHP